VQNDLSDVCLSCLIKKGNDFNNSMFSVHDQVEINGDTRDNFETALDLCVSCTVVIIIYQIQLPLLNSIAKIVSLSKNLYKLENFLTQVRYAPDTIAITETRIK